MSDSSSAKAESERLTETTADQDSTVVGPSKEVEPSHDRSGKAPAADPTSNESTKNESVKAQPVQSASKSKNARKRANRKKAQNQARKALNATGAGPSSDQTSTDNIPDSNSTSVSGEKVTDNSITTAGNPDPPNDPAPAASEDSSTGTDTDLAQKTTVTAEREPKTVSASSDADSKSTKSDSGSANNKKRKPRSKEEELAIAMAEYEQFKKDSLNAASAAKASTKSTIEGSKRPDASEKEQEVLEPTIKSATEELVEEAAPEGKQALSADAPESSTSVDLDGLTESSTIAKETSDNSNQTPVAKETEEKDQLHSLHEDFAALSTTSDNNAEPVPAPLEDEDEVSHADEKGDSQQSQLVSEKNVSVASPETKSSDDTLSKVEESLSTFSLDDKQEGTKDVSEVSGNKCIVLQLTNKTEN